MEILDFKAKPIPYQKMYTALFNAITDAIEEIEENKNPAGAAQILRQAQQSTEEQYIKADEP